MQNAREFLPKHARVYPAAVQNEQIDSRNGDAPSADRDASADRICCPVQHGHDRPAHAVAATRTSPENDPQSSRRLPKQTRQRQTPKPSTVSSRIRLTKTPHTLDFSSHPPRKPWPASQCPVNQDHQPPPANQWPACPLRRHSGDASSSDRELWLCSHSSQQPDSPCRCFATLAPHWLHDLSSS